MIEVDAELFVFGGLPTIGVRMYGYIYKDFKMRFNDGDAITTSPVVFINGDIVYTRNTTYKIREEL
jgi:hypothetical protein